MINRFAKRKPALLGMSLLCCSLLPAMQAADQPKITPAKDLIGFTVGDDYHMASYTQISKLLLQWEKESPRLKVVSIGKTEEGRTQYMAIITSPENHKNLARYKEISQKLARAEMSDEEATKLSKEGKSIVWIDGGLHATETVNSQTLANQVFEMVSRTDDETMRFLNDNVLLMPIPNPDGVELVANWYMREPDETKRTYSTLPRLYNKYIGHDNNRDSITMNMKETINQNRVLFIEWNPQIMHNVHQTGPAGAIIFIPPFRDPFNYVFDPLVPVGIEQVGAAMHARLIAMGMGGSAMRAAAPYSTWWNGGMRTATYFHNQIGILTEIVGGPTPITIPFVPDKQLAKSDWPMPVKPQEFHYAQAIHYMTETERAVMDYASRNRETLLHNMYVMGKRSIDKGNTDTWTITPKRVNAVLAAMKDYQGPAVATSGPAGMSLGSGLITPGTPPSGEAILGRSMTAAPTELYNKILNDPAYRDPRGYVITPDQDDYPTAVKFINVLLKHGLYVEKATAAFQAGGKSYPAGSYIVRTAQSFRPAVLDMFEPQDHPMDFAYPGGPPIRPYDITGWTLAVQMAVKFDRIMEPFTAQATRLGFDAPEKVAVAKVAGPAKPAGWLVSHKENDSFILMNRLLKEKCDVYWLNEEKTVDGHTLGTGTIWVPASDKAQPIIQKAAADLGIAAYGVAEKPKGAAVKIKPIRIALVDTYGGSMPSGWLRWMLEQYEFPFEVVFPQVLDAGNLKNSFDVIVFPSGTFTEARGGRGGGGFAAMIPPDSIPEEFRSMLGAVTTAKSIPPLKTFVEEGGTVLALGSAASIGQSMGLPVKDYLVEKGTDKHLSPDKFYIPGSVLRVKYNNKATLAYGMPEKGYVFFDDSPTFGRTNSSVKAEKVAWFEGKDNLFAGWAVGQEYLDGGEIATDATVGKGKLVLIGLEATFRSTPHGTFKLFFNGLYLGATTPATIE